MTRKLLVYFWQTRCSYNGVSRTLLALDLRLIVSTPTTNRASCSHTCNSVTVGTGQKAMMPYGWEGKHRSGIALVMRHILSG